MSVTRARCEYTKRFRQRKEKWKKKFFDAVLSLNLVNNKQAPIAWYEFNNHQLENIGIIKYKANSVRIMFEGIKPSMTSELVTE